MEKIIKAAVDRGASDVHIKAGDVFRARIHGELVPLTKQALTPEQTRAIALTLMSNAGDQARLDEILDYDCSWSAPGIGRFRVNIMRQRSSIMIVMRVIPFEIPTFESLGLPPVMAQIAQSERGMILVTGAAGSGKSSTMAALIHQINQDAKRHILTIEDPIEFLHTDINSSVTQREVGVDTTDMKTGLRAALRQDPDVIMIGDMRDADMVDTAIKAAETGHLLLATIHTPDAQSTVLRLVAMFPVEQQEAIRIRLAESLTAVISQRLLPKRDGHGRAAAAEIMLVTPTIRDMIGDRNRIGEIRDYIADGDEQNGMQTFDQALTELVISGEVAFETARAAASNPSDFELKTRMFSRISHRYEMNDISTPPLGAPATTPRRDADGVDRNTDPFKQ